MESCFSSLKTERTASRDEAKADVFDYIERFYKSETPALDDRLYESPWSSRGRLDWLKQVHRTGAAQPLLSMSPS